MEHLLLAIDQGTIDWSRAQFALTSMYHWLFVPLTLGLAVIMGIMETCYYRTGKDFWRTASKFWQRIFGINFAIGIATGIILEFEFGTNWSNYSWFVGDIFGAPLAVEGILAFFMESTFVAVMFFGWNKVSKGFHLASTWLTGLGATISAWWILVANSWMQDPVGCSFNPETMRNEMTSFADVALSPFAIDKFTHTVTSSWLLGAAFTVGVGCWYLLRNKHTELARQSIKIGAIVGLVSSLLAAFTGDNSAYMVAQTQPMKLAAMEALYTGGNAQGLTAIAGVTEQPNIEASPKEAKGIKIPNMLSLLATHDANGFVPGVHDIINGYTDHKGVKQPSLAEKMARGRNAIKALKDFRAGKNKEANRKVLERDMKYFGYGYIKNAQQTVPHIPITFWSFRIMVGLGSLFVLAFIVIIFFVYKKDIAKAKWLHYVGIALIPLAYIASESGWIVAEMGRQPWTIQDMLPTWVSVSDISSGGVAFTFFL